MVNYEITHLLIFLITAISPIILVKSTFVSCLAVRSLWLWHYHSSLRC